MHAQPSAAALVRQPELNQHHGIQAWDSLSNNVGRSGSATERSIPPGGVLLFLTALEMLFQKRQERREDNVSEIHHADDPSVFPLAMPLIVGPGAITTIILLAGQAEGAADMAAIAAVMFLVLLSVLLAFLVAPVLERLLGKTGLNILTRILGMLLAALAVQFILDGLLETFGMAA